MGLIYGVGINDAGYTVKGVKDGQYWGCKFYEVWKGILERCYSKRIKLIRPSYNGCIVAPEWHRFSTFKQWMQEQNWEGKQLDKDLIVQDNKVYGPNTCVFVSQKVNAFVVGSVKKANPELPPNITYRKSGSYRAGGTDVNGKGIYLGSSKDIHVVVKLVNEHKKKMAMLLADSEEDKFVSSLIRKRYEVKE